jgi:hypothetical protein
MTLERAPIESTNALIIFFNPGNFATDLNGLNTRKLLNVDKFGMIGIMEKILKKKSREEYEKQCGLMIIYKNTIES